MRPEWLVDIPNDLAHKWCVLPRPEGRRSLVVASRGRTAARAKTGGVSRRFASALPGGSRRTRRGGGDGDFCILDCVFHEPDATYYVLDTLAWNGVSLYDCAAEMRAAWTHAKLGHPETAECPEAGAADANTNAFRFAPLPVYDADAAGIRISHSGAPAPRRRSSDAIACAARIGMSRRLSARSTSRAAAQPIGAAGSVASTPSSSSTSRLVRATTTAAAET